MPRHSPRCGALLGAGSTAALHRTPGEHLWLCRASTPGAPTDSIYVLDLTMALKGSYPLSVFRYLDILGACVEVSGKLCCARVVRSGSCAQLWTAETAWGRMCNLGSLREKNSGMGPLDTLRNHDDSHTNTVYIPSITLPAREGKLLRLGKSPQCSQSFGCTCVFMNSNNSITNAVTRRQDSSHANFPNV